MVVFRLFFTGFIVILLQNYAYSKSLSAIRGSWRKGRALLQRRWVDTDVAHSGDSEPLLRLRGGEMIKRGKTRKKQGAAGALKEIFMDIAPSTRRYLSLCLFCTAVHCVGLPAPTMFNLDKTKLYQLWRPFTAVSYFGAPSMSMANSIYFLVRYGQTLENEFGTGVHTWFLLVQVAILSLLGWGIGFPFVAQSMISAAVYVCSHLRPMEKMPFQFGLTITSWQLPFAMMGIEMLSQQSAAAAWPHVLGIFSGHCYHFFTKIWPNMGGKAWLQAPKLFEKRFGGKRSSNVAGVDFREKKEMRSAKLTNRARTLSKKTGTKLGAGRGEATGGGTRGTSAGRGVGSGSLRPVMRTTPTTTTAAASSTRTKKAKKSSKSRSKKSKR